MSGDARPRRGVVAAAVALLIAGGAAVACGVAGQEPGPPAVQEQLATPDDGGSPAAEPSPATTPPPSAEPSAKAEPAKEQPLPTAVRIPSIEVDSKLLTLGREDDGTLAVPEGPDADLAAWYDGSPRPGATGPAVIEGHVDSQNGASVFHELARVAPGDEVEVDREDGSTVTFVVEDVQAFPKDEFPTLAVYSNTDDAELRLITCGGSIDPSTGHYTDNTVVFARLADR